MDSLMIYFQGFDLEIEVEYRGSAPSWKWDGGHPGDAPEWSLVDAEFEGEPVSFEELCERTDCSADELYMLVGEAIEQELAYLADSCEDYL